MFPLMVEEQKVFNMDENSPANDLFPENPDTLSERDLFHAIRERVAYLLETNPELLMSYLYRFPRSAHGARVSAEPR